MEVIHNLRRYTYSNMTLNASGCTSNIFMTVSVAANPPKNIASKKRPSPSQRHKNLTIAQVCTQDSEYVQHLVNRMHAKHLVNRDYETLLLGDFG